MSDQSEEPKTSKYIRKCLFCGKTMDEPLHFEGRIYKFCSIECKRAWDNGRKVLQRLAKIEEF